MPMAPVIIMKSSHLHANGFVVCVKMPVPSRVDVKSDLASVSTERNDSCLTVSP